MEINIKKELRKIFKKLAESKTSYPVVLKTAQGIENIGYPRIEFEVLEIKLNSSLTVGNKYLEETMEIEDSYNRVSTYMIDFNFIKKGNKSENIDDLILLLSNQWKMDRYFDNLNLEEFFIQDLVYNRDFKSQNKDFFYNDQSVTRNGYSFTVDVDLVEKDIIPAGVHGIFKGEVKR